MPKCDTVRHAFHLVTRPNCLMPAKAGIHSSLLPPGEGGAKRRMRATKKAAQSSGLSLRTVLQLYFFVSAFGVSDVPAGLHFDISHLPALHLLMSH